LNHERGGDSEFFTASTAAEASSSAEAVADKLVDREKTDIFADGKRD
jgi:hypothetical protein